MLRIPLPLTQDAPAITPARNIDILSHRPCDQQCRQCSYVEAETDPDHPRGSTAEIDFIRRVRASYPDSAFFLYPRDIVTALPLLPVMQEVGQTDTLTNGNRLEKSLVERLRGSGLKTIQITLFGTAAEQEFYNRNTPEEYDRIKDHLRLCVEQGLQVQVNNVLSRGTMRSMEALGDECLRLGVSRIRFLRLQPIGDARLLPADLLLTQADLVETIIPTFERLKAKYGRQLYLSFGVNFGPNFFGKTVAEAREKIRKRTAGSATPDVLCPAIDGQYWNISTQSGSVHWCFHNIAEPELRVGKVDWGSGKVTIDQPVDLSRETLRKKLGGICAADRCQYQEVCLGGCRSAAISFSPEAAGKERLYAGMDMCLTPAYEAFQSRRGNEASAAGQ